MKKASPTKLREWAGRSILRVLQDVGLDRPGFAIVCREEGGDEPIDSTAYSAAFADVHVANILEAVACKLRHAPTHDAGKKRPDPPR